MTGTAARTSVLLTVVLTRSHCRRSVHASEDDKSLSVSTTPCSTSNLTGRMPELIVCCPASTFSTHVTVSPTVTVLVVLTPAPHGIVTTFPALAVVVVVVRGAVVVVVVGGAVGVLPAHHTSSPCMQVQHSCIHTLHNQHKRG